MLINQNCDKNIIENVRFISYDGKWPNLCSGKLVLEVCGKKYFWKEHSGIIASGGGINSNYEGSYQEEWEVDYNKIPDEIKQYANEIDRCINDNVTWGCCGGCI